MNHSRQYNPYQRRRNRARRIAIWNSLFVLFWAICFAAIYVPTGM